MEEEKEEDEDQHNSQKHLNTSQMSLGSPLEASLGCLGGLLVVQAALLGRLGDLRGPLGAPFCMFQ